MARRRKRRSGGKKRKIDWKKVRKVSMWAGIIWGSYELYLAAVLRKQRRRDAFNAALQAANEAGKPLYVVGDPKAGLQRVLGADFDCADGCVSLADAEALGTNSAVLFVADDKLEESDDLPATLSELTRASGGALFATHLNKWSLVTWLPLAGRGYAVYETPPHGQAFIFRELPWKKGKSTKQTIAGLRLVG